MKQYFFLFEIFLATFPPPVIAWISQVMEVQWKYSTLNTLIQTNCSHTHCGFTNGLLIDLDRTFWVAMRSWVEDSITRLRGEGILQWIFAHWKRIDHRDLILHWVHHNPPTLSFLHFHLLQDEKSCSCQSKWIWWQLCVRITSNPNIPKGTLWGITI